MKEKGQSKGAEGKQSRESEGQSEGEHLYDDWDDLATDPEEVSKLGRALEGILPDIIKRGVGGLVNEDGIRALVKDRELPKEAVGFLMGQVDATKREVLRIVSKEVRMFLENVDLGGELTKILTSVSFEVRTEVRFIPNDAAVKPSVRNRVSVRGRDGSSETLAEDEDFGEPLTEPGEDTEEPRGKRRRWSLRRRSEQDEEEADTSVEDSPAADGGSKKAGSKKSD